METNKSKRAEYGRQDKYDFDKFFLEKQVETRGRMLSNKKSSDYKSFISAYSDKNKSVSAKIPIMNQRSANYLATLVVVKVKYERLSQFLQNNNIIESGFELNSLKIGSYVFSFKIMQSEIDQQEVLKEKEFSFTLIKSIPDFEKLSKNIQKLIKNPIYVLDSSIIHHVNDDPEKVLNYLETYLNKLICDVALSNLSLIYDFLEISEFKYEPGSSKYRECYLLKQSGGRFKGNSCCFQSSHKKWFIIVSEGIFYVSNPNIPEIRDFFLFDVNFKLKYGFRNTGSLRKLSITTMTRELIVKCESTWELYLLINALGSAVSSCEYVQINRYVSFAPQRIDNYCEAFVDGEDYFKEVYNHINQAKNEIYITDWWLSPELFLQRPGKEHFRLDNLLKTQAEKGVKIYIIVYKEVSIVLPLNSIHTKKALEGLHPNISVLRHPPSLIFLWSHHEKMIIIDQSIGFLGGLDLCFGRMDNNNHYLFDDNNNFWNGKDYSNCRIADFRNVVNFEEELIEKNVVPRMPWHDVAVIVKGDILKDLTRHFIQYWNFVKISMASKTNKTDNKEKKKKKVIDIKDRRNTHFNNYQAAFSKFLDNLNDKQIELNGIPSNQEDKIKESMPSIRIEEKGDLDLSKYEWKNHLKTNLDTSEIQSTDTNAISPSINKKKEKEITLIVPNINNHFGQDFVRQVKKKLTTLRMEISSLSMSNTIKEVSTFSIKSKPATRQSILKKIPSLLQNSILAPKKNNDELIDQEDLSDPLSKKSLLKPALIPERHLGTCRIQMVRSASNWSCGIENTRIENSIQMAYLQLIEEAKYFIYIENQFFISCSAGNIVKNKIAEALILRIKMADNNNENFKVYVVLPLLPAFEGDITERKSAVLRIQLYWEYQTISRGENSIIERLKAENIDPFKYIRFFSLRTHGLNKNGKPCSEMVYIHSKIMIIDDNKVIIGSANINDRSLNGNRDSEIAVIIEDSKKIISRMNGSLYESGKFVYNLRLRLWNEIFGYTCDDPINNEFWNNILERSKKNTDIFREIFRCYPDNNMKKFKDIEIHKNNAQIQQYENLKSEIQGFVVDFPTEFLKDEDLKFSLLETEFYCPDHNFT